MCSMWMLAAVSNYGLSCEHELVRENIDWYYLLKCIEMCVSLKIKSLEKQ